MICQLLKQEFRNYHYNLYYLLNKELAVNNLNIALTFLTSTLHPLQTQESVIQVSIYRFYSKLFLLFYSFSISFIMFKTEVLSILENANHFFFFILNYRKFCNSCIF